MKTVENVHHVKINFFFSWSRFLKLRLFSRDFDASRLSRFVETHFLMLSRFSRLSRLTLWQRRDRESRSRPRRDKLRPPGLLRTEHVGLLDCLPFSILNMTHIPGRVSNMLEISNKQVIQFNKNTRLEKWSRINQISKVFHTSML